MTGTMDREPTVILLPQTEGDLVCIRYRGIVNRNDFEKFAYDVVKKVVDQKGSLNLLAEFADDFQGWEEDAAALNFKTVFEQGAFCRKIAYINPPSGKILHLKLMKPAIPGTVRNFEKNEFEQALAWLKEA